MESQKLSDSFIHFFQDRIFLQTNFFGNSTKILGSDGNIGVRYAFGPFCVEYYTGDQEPVVRVGDPRRAGQRDRARRVSNAAQH